MNQKALKVLEYDKIIQLLAEQATSDAGKKRCLELVPMTDKQLIDPTNPQPMIAAFCLFISVSSRSTSIFHSF